MADLPPLFVDRMRAFLGPEEYDAYRGALEGPPHVGLRVNTLKIDVETFRRIAPFTLEPVPWCPTGFRVVDGPRPGKHPYHAAGLYYIQEPSAMAPAEILAPQPGERVLDLAAAPGGKTTHLASLMQGQGLLVANDVQPKRVHEMTNNLDRWGARHIVVTQESPGRLARRWPGMFDRVLVDAPCSGEGMFRKDPAARRTWTPKHVQRCAALQRKILRAAAQLVRPGGYLLYSTCTFAPEENEGTLAWFLARHPEYTLVPIPHEHGFAPGRPEWLTPPGPEALRGAARLWPHRVPGEGHFLALLQRRGDEPQPRELPRPRLRPLPAEARRLWRAFVDEHLREDPVPPTYTLAQFGHRLYAVPPHALDWSGLKVVRFGWWLGNLKAKRFEPAHSLALALHADQAYNRRDWTADDPRVRQYLHGEPIPDDGPPGWVLVTVDGYPLGWARSVQGVLKSRAPRWLRRI
ncbi:MAG: NOL1/NOP2/sun family putative RNA methylase [Chloroflexi bacterium]|nr:NOL1/NOP2/sun family putative RNA methylase [Chloroflexota bacterium]